MARLATVDFKSKLKMYSEILKEQEEANKDNNKQGTLPSIPDPYGVAIEKDSGIEKTRIFLSDFSENDVDYFIDFLKANAPNLHRNNLEELIIGRLNNWIINNPDACPIEPFLWALKNTDNYIGSVQNNANPQPWILESVSRALCYIWENDNDTYRKVLRNVLLNWDWYQPIHVMLDVYGRLLSVNEPEIDSFIRNEWLYRALYSTTAFKCLYSKRKTTNNIRALMLFVSQDKQQDLNMTDINITKKMRKLLMDYIRNSSPDEYAVAKTYYYDSLYNCSKKARECFEELFGDPDKHEVQEFIVEWINNKSDEGRFLLMKRLSNLFIRKSDELINEAAVSKQASLIKEVIYVFEQQDFVFKTQFWVRAFARSARICVQYRELITRLFNTTNGSFSNDASFVYGCGYCQMGHPEILPQLFDALYINSTGIQNGKHCFLSLRLSYSMQFGEAINNMILKCENSMERTLAVIRACSKIYNVSALAGLYPPEFDKLCDKVFEEVKKEKPGYSTRYASELLNLYEKIVNIQNRNRYTYQLQYIATNIHLSEMLGAKKRASKLLESIYRPL